MRKKRFLCLFLALTMVLSTMPYGVFAAEDNSRQRVSYEAEWTNPVYGSDVAAPETAGNTFSLRSADYYTTVEEAGAYLRQQMVKRETTVEFKFTSENFSKETFDTIYEEAVKHTGVPTEGDSLQFVCSGWAGGASGIVGEPYLAVTYNITYYTNEEQEFVATSEISDLKMNLEMDGKSDYEKVRAIYDYMTANIEYDYKNLDDESYTLKYTAYAALVKKTAVCQGYATLFYRLALSYGIDARVITGQSHGENHAWNIVKLDGKYYYLDSTWDSTWDADKTNHTYFLKGSANFGEHTPNSEYAAADFVSAYPMDTDDYVVRDSDLNGGGDQPGDEPQQPDTPDMPDEPDTPDESEDVPDSTVVTEGNFTAEIYGGEATITAYTGTSEVHVVVPSKIKGYPVKEIGKHSFYHNQIIETITISEGIECLNSWWIYYCNGVKTISLPSTMEELDLSRDTGFGSSSGLESIQVSEKNKKMTSEDGVIYSKDMKILRFYPQGKKDKVFRIPYGVKTIFDDACSENVYLEEVVMPDTVDYIGYWAFNDDGKLKKINISSQCTVIGQYAFQNTLIEHLHIPASVEFIIPGATYGMEHLSTITVDEKNERYETVDGVLMSGNELITYPADREGEAYAIPRNITVIERNAFMDAVKLKEVLFHDKIKEIPYGAFYNCASLQRIVIPSSVVEIEDSAFFDCLGLESITIPSSVKKIGSNAFANVGGLVIYAEPQSYAYSYAKENGFGTLQPGQTTVSGKQGENIYWKIEDNILTVSGTGKLEYTYYDDGTMREPWTPYGGIIKQVNIEEGITSVETYAFYGYHGGRGPKTILLSASVGMVDVNCYGCKSIIVLNKDCEFIPGPIVSEDCTIYGFEGSTAEMFAEENDLNFEVVSSTNDHIHAYGEWVTDKAATCENEGQKHRTCTICGIEEKRTMLKAAHNNTTLIAKPATTTSNGLTEGKKCSVCGTVTVLQETIAAIGTVKLSYDKKAYTGKTIAAPKLTVTDTSSKELVSGTDYTVTGLTDQKEVGRYKVTVTFKGNYAGTETLYFNIVPKKTSSAKAVLYGYDDIQFSWSKAAGASGYLVYYKKGSGSWSKAVVTTKTYYKKANLSDGVKYTFKVVPYYKTKTSTTKYYDANQYKTAYTYTLKQVTGVKVTKSGTKVKVSWSNISGETGYQISKMTSSKAIQKKPLTYKTTSGKYKKLSATRGKTYYYRVRAYKVVNGKTIYGPWSGSVKYKRK